MARVTDTKATCLTQGETPYEASSSSSCTDNSKRCTVPNVTGESPVMPFWVHVTASAERLGRLTMSDDRAMPVSPFVSHAQTSAIDSAAAADEAKHATDVNREHFS